MNEAIRKRIEINQRGTIRDKTQAALHSAAHVPNLPINTIDLGIAFEQGLEAQKRLDLEVLPRDTFLKMLIQKPELEVDFIFRVAKGEGDHYIQAMRQVISRTRKKAKRDKVRLQDFKLIVKSIETKEDHDVVTLIRAKSMNAVQRSVYDQLLDAFEQPRGKE